MGKRIRKKELNRQWRKRLDTWGSNRFGGGLSSKKKRCRSGPLGLGEVGKHKRTYLRDTCHMRRRKGGNGRRGEKEAAKERGGEYNTYFASHGLEEEQITEGP